MMDHSEYERRRYGAGPRPRGLTPGTPACPTKLPEFQTTGEVGERRLARRSFRSLKRRAKSGSAGNVWELRRPEGPRNLSPGFEPGLVYFLRVRSEGPRESLRSDKTNRPRYLGNSAEPIGFTRSFRPAGL